MSDPNNRPQSNNPIKYIYKTLDENSKKIKDIHEFLMIFSNNKENYKSYINNINRPISDPKIDYGTGVGDYRGGVTSKKVTVKKITAKKAPVKKVVKKKK